MANRINQLLEYWNNNKTEHEWVLATIIETEGSSYRKAGAMMLINDMGQYFGMLSGGCLESDIMRQARRCWDNHQSRIIEYDMREEEDLAWQLGIGCGGRVKILLQPVSKQNDYLKLHRLKESLDQGMSVVYEQPLFPADVENKIVIAANYKRDLGLVSKNNLQIFSHALHPAPKVAVFGGGMDARPVVAIAAQLGWQVTLLDPRVGYAKEGYFDGAINIMRTDYSALEDSSFLKQISAAFVLTHNVKLDGQALKILQNSAAKYVGLLGPIHRTERVLDSAGMSKNTLQKTLANPVGLALGGELPESIALSMISEAHAVIENGNGQSISGVLN